MNESWTLPREEMIDEMISLDEKLSEDSRDFFNEMDEDDFSFEYQEITGNVVIGCDGEVFEIY